VEKGENRGVGGELTVEGARRPERELGQEVLDLNRRAQTRLSRRTGWRSVHGSSGHRRGGQWERA
jgi:hypothetical protein